MKAILIKEKGGPENLVLAEYPSPSPMEGFVLVQIKAFGINHAEMYMRRGDWGDTADIIGIECVGVVVEDPSGEYSKGQKVATMVGGMARSINGSYAEYINVPRANVMAFRSELPWNELAAIPESYGTAWTLLNWALDAKAGEVLELIGNSSLADSLECIRPMGSIVLAGFLGGLAPLENFHPIFHIPKCIRLTALGSSFIFGQKGFEYAKIPLQKMISDIEAGDIRNILRKTFAVENIAEAHSVAESGEVNGKVVVEW